MSNIKNKLAVTALAIFSVHPNIDEIYVTSDNNGFTEKEKMNDHLKLLKDKTFQHFVRGFDEAELEDDDLDPADTGNQNPAPENTNKDADPKATDAERPALVEKYTALFGKPPHHMSGVDKLKAAITEKEAELAKGSNRHNLKTI
ncbi:hypothetical protein [Elizabethkingia phage TCUEAP3]|nr:hypothetical protein [Elizabethkingia phage TCUEAP3]